MTYTFNNINFFQSDVQFTFMPDLIVMDMTPKMASVQQSLMLKIYVKNTHPQGNYFCRTNDGQISEATIKLEKVAQFGIDRLYLYCTIETLLFPGKQYIEVLTNVGLYSAKVSNYIDVRYPQAEKDSISGVGFFSIVQVEENIFAMGPMQQLIIPSKTFIPIDKSKLINDTACFINKEIRV